MQLDGPGGQIQSILSFVASATQEALEWAESKEKAQPTGNPTCHIHTALCVHTTPFYTLTAEQPEVKGFSESLCKLRCDWLLLLLSGVYT